MLSYEKARTILKEVEFPGDTDPTYLLALSGKKERRLSLLKKNEKSKISAAIEIQRVWRGYTTRCKLEKVLCQNKRCFTINIQKQDYPHVYSKYQNYLQWCQEQDFGPNSTAILTLEDYSAQLIQSWWKRIHLCQPVHLGVSTMVGKKVKKRRKLTVQEAALIIQRNWKRLSDMKTFQSYRDLINFKGKGDPALMLRNINPKEAQLLDKAAGAHIRFRLGGTKFPPNIYYKIYTHRPIIDLCASSPRDYTTMINRLQLPRDRHNKDSRSLAADDQTNWYKRHENNGWRLVSDRPFLGPLQDEITTETSHQKHNFHHSKLQRRQELAQKKKKRKIDWLRKMYREGMLKAKEDMNVRAQEAVELATKEVVALTENYNPEEVDDEDIDELLTWTNGLNFEEYVTEWYSSASSAFSDEELVYPSEDDDYTVIVKCPSGSLQEV